MPSKCYGPSKKKFKTEKCHQKALRSFSKKVIMLKMFSHTSALVTTRSCTHWFHYFICKKEIHEKKTHSTFFKKIPSLRCGISTPTNWGEWEI